MVHPDNVTLFITKKKRNENTKSNLRLNYSMKLGHALWGHPRWVGMVERSDTMWSTGEGNGKPLQYSCLEKMCRRWQEMQIQDRV